MAAVDAMTAVLEERLVAVRENLTCQDVLKDGNCQYRSVSMQCRQYGWSGHERLRQKAIDHVEANKDDFLPFFAGESQTRRLNAWIRSARTGAWGDNVSLVAMCRVLRRPVAVWLRSPS